MIVYKYRQSSEVTDKIFTRKKVWLPTPAALNDPFEAQVDFGADFPASIEKMRNAQVSAFLEAARYHRKMGLPFYGLSRKAIYTLVERFKNLSEIKTAYQAYSSFVEARTGLPPLDPAHTYSSIPEQLSSIGIFSLSETSENSLMWAHYSGSHEGICIGFEVTDDSALADSAHCLHVTYSDTSPTLNDVMAMELKMAMEAPKKLRSPGSALLSHPMIQAKIATKGQEWAYEKEWRYVEFSSGEHDWPAPIVEIIFGLKCSKKQRDHYTTLVKANVPNDVRMYEIVKVQGQRSFERVMLGIVSPDEAESVSDPDIGLIHRLLSKRRFVAALAATDALLSQDSASAEAWRCKGIALGWSEDHLGALECFTKGIVIEPKNFSLHYQKGVALTALGRYDDSLNEYKIAQELHPAEPSFPFNLGMNLFHLKRPGEAIIELEKASRLGHPRADDALARIKLEINKKQGCEV
jgi:tetratricopeptide (TPR) repeat protein